MQDFSRDSSAQHAVLPGQNFDNYFWLVYLDKLVLFFLIEQLRLEIIGLLYLIERRYLFLSI